MANLIACTSKVSGRFRVWVAKAQGDCRIDLEKALQKKKFVCFGIVGHNQEFLVIDLGSHTTSGNANSFIASELGFDHETFVPFDLCHAHQFGWCQLEAQKLLEETPSVETQLEKFKAFGHGEDMRVVPSLFMPPGEIELEYRMTNTLSAPRKLEWILFTAPQLERPRMSSKDYLLGFYEVFLQLFQDCYTGASAHKTKQSAFLAIFHMHTKKEIVVKELEPDVRSEFEALTHDKQTRCAVCGQRTCVCKTKKCAGCNKRLICETVFGEMSANMVLHLFQVCSEKCMNQSANKKRKL